MRKLAFLAATVAAALLGIAATAHAATNHSATWSLSSAKAGTKASPKPVGVKQTFDVTTDDGSRPEITSDYALSLQGVHQNTKYFAHCTKAKILSQGQGACRSAKVGSGIVDNLAGVSASPTSKIPCRLAMNLYNGPTNHLLLVVNGGPSVQVNGPGGPRNCPLSVSDTPIDASFRNTARGATIAFHVDEIPLQHPQSGVDNALVRVETKLDRKVKRVRVGRHTRSVGYLESFTCPRGKKLSFTTTFTSASTGARSVASALTACR